MGLVATEHIMVITEDGRAVQLAPGEKCDHLKIRSLDEYVEARVIAEVEDVEAAEPDGGDHGDGDLTAGTAPEVMARVRQDPETAQAVLDAELAGQGRKGLVADLRALLGLEG